MTMTVKDIFFNRTIKGVEFAITLGIPQLAYKFVFVIKLENGYFVFSKKLYEILLCHFGNFCTISNGDMIATVIVNCYKFTGVFIYLHR